MNFKNLLEKLRILFRCKVLSKILIPQSKLCFDSEKKKSFIGLKLFFFREINVTIFLKIVTKIRFKKTKIIISSASGIQLFFEKDCNNLQYEYTISLFSESKQSFD